MSRAELDRIAGKRIVVIRFSALGDVAMTIPVIYSFAMSYPQMEVHCVTNTFFAQLFINPPHNIRMHKVDLKKDYSGPIGILRLLRYVYRIHPDYVADLHNVGLSWIIDLMFWLTGRRLEMVDKMRSTRKKVLKGKLVHPSLFTRYASVFSRLGFPIKVKKLEMECGWSSKCVEITHPAVGIAPFARYINKTYPLELVEELIRLLIGRGMNVYLFGSRGREKLLLESLAEKFYRCFSLAGKYSLRQEITMIAEMDVMVSMDSANHHIASLTGTPVVSIWGSTTPACGFMGYGQSLENAVFLGLECQPCTIAGSNKCKKGNFECLSALSPYTVLNKIEELLSHNA